MVKLGNISQSSKPHNVRDTSKDAFAELQESGEAEEMEQVIYKALKEIQPATRRMIAEHLKALNGSIPQYATKLLKKGLAMEEPIKRACKVTGRKAYYLILIDSKKNNDG